MPDDEGCGRMALAWWSWELWASALVFLAAGALLLWRLRRADRWRAEWSPEPDGFTMRAHRVTKRVRWSEVRAAREEGDLVVLDLADGNEIGVPLREAERLGLPARFLREGEDVRRE